MKPSQVAQLLRRIAAKIDQSNRPLKHLVARDLKKIIASVVGNHIGSLDLPDKPTAADSQLMWFAMRDLGMDNWDSEADPNIVIEKIKEIAKANGFPNANRAVNYAAKNWKNYLKYTKDDVGPDGSQDNQSQ